MRLLATASCQNGFLGGCHGKEAFEAIAFRLEAIALRLEVISLSISISLLLLRDLSK